MAAAIASIVGITCSITGARSAPTAVGHMRPTASISNTSPTGRAAAGRPSGEFPRRPITALRGRSRRGQPGLAGVAPLSSGDHPNPEDLNTRGGKHEGTLLARQGRRPRRHRPRPEDRGPARRDHQDHVHRHLRLRPAPLRRLHADHGGRRRPRPRADGRGRRGRQRRHEPEEGRPRRRPVHHLLRRLLVLQAGSCSRSATPPTRNAEIARKAMGQSPAGPVRLLAHARRLSRAARREYLRVPYADVGPLKIPDGLPDEKVALPLRHLPDRLHGRRERRDRAGRHGRGLGLRPGRPVRHPERLDARGRAGDRHRPRARAAGDGPRARQGRDDQLRRGGRLRHA